MTGAEIAALLVKFGPPAFKMIEQLVSIWTSQLDPEEVVAFCNEHKKSYDDYIAEARAVVDYPTQPFSRP